VQGQLKSKMVCYGLRKNADNIIRLFCYILSHFTQNLAMTESSIRNNHDRGKVGDFLKEHVVPNSELTVVSTFFNN